MSDVSSKDEAAVTCPLCGSTAEQGCVYGSDKGWLHWYAGPPRILGQPCYRVGRWKAGRWLGIR